MLLKFPQPKWAKRLERMMATVQEKLDELEASMAEKSAAISASLDGITGDLATQSAEIEALKQAVIDAGSNAGELPQDLVERFDALKSSIDAVAQKAADLDAAMPNTPPVEEPPPEEPPAEPV
jgi:Skp family chaperone for outer membrane proteins